mmetsp:Transcript_48824/g.93381  ORF Transcript_48824/g.93381 Transcript_48824/m.93381 type:complete len:176 (+) Transcript_48824:636-1163(+)
MPFFDKMLSCKVFWISNACIAPPRSYTLSSDQMRWSVCQVAFSGPGDRYSEVRKEYMLALESFKNAAGDSQVAELADFDLLVDELYPLYAMSQQADTTGELRRSAAALRSIALQSRCPALGDAAGLGARVQCAFGYAGPKATAEEKQDLAKQACAALEASQPALDRMFSIDPGLR